MKKSVNLLMGIALILAVGTAGAFGYLYFSEDRWDDDVPATNTSVIAESEKAYKDFLASTEAEKYYHLLEDDEDEFYELWDYYEYQATSLLQSPECTEPE